MDKQIILLSGKNGSGKDTIGYFLTKKFDYERIAFADALKDEVYHEYSSLFEFSRNDLDTNKEMILSTGYTLRKLIIQYATLRREYDKDVWAISSFG